VQKAAARVRFPAAQSSSLHSQSDCTHDFVVNSRFIGFAVIELSRNIRSCKLRYTHDEVILIEGKRGKKKKLVKKTVRHAPVESHQRLGVSAQNEMSSWWWRVGYHDEVT